MKGTIPQFCVHLLITLSACYKMGLCLLDKNIMFQAGRGHWAVYYNSTQSFIITFLIRWLNNIWDFY